MRRLERLSNAIAAGVSRQHHRSRGKPCDRCNIRFDRRLWSCVALTQACCASIAYRKMGENHFRGLRRPKAAAPETTTQSIVEVLEPGRSLLSAYLRAAQAYMLISMPTGTSTILGALQAISRTPGFTGTIAGRFYVRRISKVVQAYDCGSPRITTGPGRPQPLGASAIPRLQADRIIRVVGLSHYGRCGVGRS
jgi:hypothetical protein